MLDVNDKPKKIRNYSFRDSKRLPPSKMTEINGIRVPSMPGSCYHAVICSLSQNKNKFCPWDRIIEMTERYMKQYGGQKAWDKFTSKGGVKSYKQRIKDNTHTLTRTGKDCYGYRLHERGMAIYFFKDGAILFTGGEMKQDGDSYNVVFADGRKLQKRYRGTTMLYQEYRTFLDKGWIDINGTIIDQEAIRDYRAGLSDIAEPEQVETSTSSENSVPQSQVCVTLVDSFDQSTADRLESYGLVVENALQNELIGNIASDSLTRLQNDQDVIDVVVMGGDDG